MGKRRTFGDDKKMVRVASALFAVAIHVVGAALTGAQAQTVPAGGKKEGAAASSDASPGGAKKQRDPADIEKALASAQKSLSAGKADVAAKQMDSLINAGGLDPRSVARALALRGHANRKLGKPAQAIADLQSALYVKNGLSETERTSALEARAQAHREAGLPEPASPTATTVKSDARPADTRVSTPIATATVPEKAAAPASSGGVGGFFSNLFGGSKTQDPPSKSGGPDAGVAPPPPLSPAVSSWSEPAKAKAPAKIVATDVPKVIPQPRPAPSKAIEAPKPEPVKASPPPRPTSAPAEPAPTQFALRLAAKRTSADAKTLAERIKREHAADLGSRSYTIDESVFGNMGKFYRANVGPFADLQGAKTLCASIRARGTDCEVISR